MSQSKPRANWTQLSHELWGAIFARLTQDIGDDDFLSSRLDEAGFHQLRLVCKIFKHILSSRERALEGLNVTAQQVQAQRSQQGSAQQGAAQQGAAQQGSAQPGPLQQGAAPQGPAQQGRLQQGAAQQGSAQPGPPQQGAASAQSQLPLTVSLMTAEQQQEQCVTMLTTVLKSVHAGLQLALPQQEAVVNTAVAVIGTTMAPLIKMLVTAEARHEQMYSAIQGVKADTTEVKKMMHSKASSNPLTAVAMAQGSQQMHGLGQCLSSRSSGSLSSASQAAVSPSKSPSPPLDTPARKLQQKNFKARELAKRQAQRLQDVLGTSGASASANAMTATAGRVVDGFKIVYPGSDGEVAWTSWGGRFNSLTAYDSLQDMLDEWRVGIVYVDKIKRTVPMEQLEKDHQTGVQIAAEDTKCAPWRSFQARTKIWGRKRIIYSLLSAEKSGEDLTVYMQGLKEEAEKVLQAAPKKKGVKTTLISTMQKLLLAEHDVGNPVSFEMEVLEWKVTPAIQKQAISKQKGNVAAE